jgi:DNA polymerase/3'-5' exonuclease PolX
MKYEQALEIAGRIKAELAPHCERIEIAGSIRRKKPEVKDIEIVAIPKPYDIGLFESGIATVVKQWKKVKGELPCKYTQRILPEGIMLDLFFAERENWGNIFATRTGSANYSHLVLAVEWVSQGYKSEGGYLYDDNEKIAIPEEEDLFKLLGLSYVAPELRDF